jgi:hypothetical protein
MFFALFFTLSKHPIHNKQESNAGLNFAYDDEANKFYEVVAKKIEAKTRRSENKIPRSGAAESLQTPQNTQQPTKVFSTQPLAMQPLILNVSPHEKYASEANVPKSASGGLFGTLKSGKKQKKATISKIDISNPTHFRHVQHVGLSSKTNEKFEVRIQDRFVAKQKIFYCNK